MNITKEEKRELRFEAKAWDDMMKRMAVKDAIVSEEKMPGEEALSIKNEAADMEDMTGALLY